MYFKQSEATEATPLILPAVHRFVLVVVIFFMFAISILPGLILNWVE
jgi:hypothetical protein